MSQTCRSEKDSNAEMGAHGHAALASADPFRTIVGVAVSSLTQANGTISWGGGFGPASTTT